MTTADAYHHCERLVQDAGSSFAWAFRLLPQERRLALCAVYAFCRFVDDVADEPGLDDPAALLARWQRELASVYDGTPSHPIGIALADAVRRFPLARQHFEALIGGVEMDLSRRRYDTFDELYEYCYRVASTVGLLCIEIFGRTHPSAEHYAVDLGIAFQLTNILRDVDEDAHRGRIYLPLEDLARFDCSEDDLLAGRYLPRVGALMAFECGRARAYYLRARAALAAEDRRALAAAEAMRLIYERLLARIEAKNFDVFGQRVTLPGYQKATLALAAWGRSHLGLVAQG
jgi:phytoene synthase